MEKTHISEGQKYPGNFLTDFKEEKNAMSEGNLCSFIEHSWS